jgi:hypothetical protein
MCYLYVYICLWMYWITQHCDYDVHVLNYALSNKWFEFEFGGNRSDIKLPDIDTNGESGEVAPRGASSGNHR